MSESVVVMSGTASGYLRCVVLVHVVVVAVVVGVGVRVSSIDGFGSIRL